MNCQHYFKKLDNIHPELINYAKSKWNRGCDIVIMGHYHHSFNFIDNEVASIPFEINFVDVVPLGVTLN